jgi:hypothetical protein
MHWRCRQADSAALDRAQYRVAVRRYRAISILQQQHLHDLAADARRDVANVASPRRAARQTWLKRRRRLGPPAYQAEKSRNNPSSPT